MTERERIKALECQMDRILSDVESEKGTRQRIHADHHSRISKLENTHWMWRGAGVLLGLVATIIAIIAALK